MISSHASEILPRIVSPVKDPARVLRTSLRAQDSSGSFSSRSEAVIGDDSDADSVTQSQYTCPLS